MRECVGCVIWYSGGPGRLSFYFEYLMDLGVKIPVTAGLL